ncbi:hypothetical protein NMY22_g14548 [Coprinellus aureogranulatus]|nr:hypothetical protein NMY22_g14548 [Coprinellus aureogranulatus]
MFIPQLRRRTLATMASGIPLPVTQRALTVQKAHDSSPNKEKYPFDAVVTEKQISELKPSEVLVKINAVGYNHKDLWVRKGQYPAITVGSPYGGDGAGVVVASGSPDDDLLNKRVFMVPSTGWKSHPDAPETRFGILGGTPSGGTFADYLVFERDLLIPSPDHLDDVHVAAFPLGGVTAWRAAVVNGEVKPGQNVLITGIGGGVALLVLQYCVAIGANVYVTSGKRDKIDKAIALGAKGGAIYKDKDWPKHIAELVQSISGKGAELDAVVDSGGGPIFAQIGKYLKAGGRIVAYGMTAAPSITITMREVLRNQKFFGSTMGSEKDLKDATAFVSKHRIVPVVSDVLQGFESAQEGFDLIERGDHFGKIVLKLGDDSKSSQSRL